MSSGAVALVETIRRHRVAAVVLFLLAFPLLVPYQALAVNILIFGLFAVGFNLLFGYTGLLSFGHAAFLGVGSYLTGIGMVHMGLPWGAAVLLGVVSAALAGLVIGYLAIRTRGIYFSMVTLALAQIVYYAFYKAERWTGGENGLRGIQVPSMDLLGFKLDFLDPVTKYYVILVFVAGALWFVSRLLASPFGAVIEAVRENEQRAAACGYDVARTKLLVFVISAAICGLAGAMRALHLSVVPIDSLHYLLSGQAVMMCLLGGMGTFFGPFIGAGLFLTL
jgi:branched-chain amino acid transport system permease protein